MTAFLFTLASCTFGAFIISWTDVPARRTFAHTLRSALLLIGFVISGLPLMALAFMQHPLATPLAYVALLSWTSLGTIWSIRLDPEASLRALPQWIMKPWSMPEAVITGALCASIALVLFAPAS